jgi:hypothetical protein
VHTIEMWLTAPGAEFGSVVASEAYQVPCPSVTVAPAQLALHEGPLTLNLTSVGYFGRADVVFALDGREIARTRPRLGLASSNAVLPAVPDCGSHEISSQQTHAPEDFDTTAQTTLVVTCPTITPTPSSVPQASLPSSVAVTGAGWDLGSDVALSIDGAVVATATADDAGQFTATVPLAARPCGTVAVLGVEPARPVTAVSAAVVPGPRAATSVEVTCPTITPTQPPPPPPPPADPTPPTRPAPTLVADPVVSSGGVALATGHGFTPGATVRLTWVLPDASIAPGGQKALAASDGSITVSCMVLPHARLGPRTLRAVEGGGVASAPVLVVNGPMEPGRDRLLGRR